MAQTIAANLRTTACLAIDLAAPDNPMTSTQNKQDVGSGSLWWLWARCTRIRSSTRPDVRLVKVENGKVRIKLRAPTG